MYMGKENWVYCPICKAKTRIKISYNTEVANLPAYCPKCKKQFILNVKQGYKVETKYID